MSQTKALSAHFPSTPRRRVWAWVTCDYDAQVPTSVETESRHYRCRKPFKMPWNYPRGKSLELRYEGCNSFQIGSCESCAQSPRSVPPFRLHIEDLFLRVTTFISHSGRHVTRLLYWCLLTNFWRYPMAGGVKTHLRIPPQSAKSLGETTRGASTR
jgi:hypothetical protein